MISRKEEPCSSAKELSSIKFQGKASMSFLNIFKRSKKSKLEKIEAKRQRNILKIEKEKQLRQERDTLKRVKAEEKITRKIIRKVIKAYKKGYGYVRIEVCLPWEVNFDQFRPQLVEIMKPISLDNLTVSQNPYSGLEIKGSIPLSNFKKWLDSCPSENYVKYKIKL